jgi:hypothetical protein
MTKREPAAAMLIAICALTAGREAAAAEAAAGNYRGWKTLEISNGLVQLQVAPDLGGRIIQYELDGHAYLWVNDQLAGKGPTASGLGPDDKWLNYGGEKLWPAPQGWSGDDQWPGPPDAVLDGSPHRGVIRSAQGNSAAVGLTSRDDPRSGIRFSREIRLFDGTSRVHVDATMTNVDTRSRRWGIWSVAQVDASATGPGDDYNRNLRLYCPKNPKSIFPRGYDVLFGLVNNPAYQGDDQPGMMRVHYQNRVGKIGMDTSAGWIATVDGTAGYVFVQRFDHFPDRPYPDNSSVEVWLSGPGQIAIAGEIINMEDDPIGIPTLIESELLSPYARLEPGESYTFGYDWFAAHVGGDYPVLDCTQAGVVCEPFSVTRSGDGFQVAGRFGVFYQGTAGVVFLDDAGRPLGRAKSRRSITPAQPLVLTEHLTIPSPSPKITQASLLVFDSEGREIAELARVRIDAVK